LHRMTDALFQSLAGGEVKMLVDAPPVAAAETIAEFGRLSLAKPMPKPPEETGGIEVF
jgi:hypothetical protein